MMTLGAYDPHTALIVFRDLDPWDILEAQAIRGARASYAQLMAEWHAVQAAAPLSVTMKWGGIPFGVLLLGNTGQAGVAQAALLARNHRKFRRGLATAAATIGQEMPDFCRQRGIHRVEARSWVQHPRAALFLRHAGFSHEARMSGFGADGAEQFDQFAWVARKEADHVHDVAA